MRNNSSPVQPVGRLVKQDNYSKKASTWKNNYFQNKVNKQLVRDAHWGIHPTFLIKLHHIAEDVFMRYAKSVSNWLDKMRESSRHQVDISPTFMEGRDHFPGEEQNAQIKALQQPNHNTAVDISVKPSLQKVHKWKKS